MLSDNMTKTEVMLSLQKEFKKDILPFYQNIIVKMAERTVLPKVKRTGKPKTFTKDKLSSSNNRFHIVCTVTKEKCIMYAYNEFLWRGKHCYANYFENDSVVVYPTHCLERYAERVLNNNDIAPKDVFLRYLLNKQDGSFFIALQSPKRERCLFFGLANALFLGDYDEPTKENLNYSLYWYNTCISIMEAHTTQSGILHSLSIMQKFVNELGFNPLKIESFDKAMKKELSNYIKSSKANEDNYIDFLKRTYMLHQLQLSLNFPWIDLYMDKNTNEMNKISVELAKYNVCTNTLSPFDTKEGFAIEGEINYRDK